MLDSHLTRASLSRGSRQQTRDEDPPRASWTFCVCYVHAIKGQIWIGERASESEVSNGRQIK